MKHIIKQGNVVLEAFEAHDRNYLKFGHTVISKRQLNALGFTITVEPSAEDCLKWMLSQQWVTSSNVELVKAAIILEQEGVAK
tara:strand:- start:3182 stop:3430 length:249 start_codon:yes stop_codon:yes gene_type:complete